MKILEVRDGFLKFEADAGIYLSSFVQIDGIDKSYVAQVIQLKKSGENSIAYAKILFLYDGTLLTYDKTLPSKDSDIKEFTFDILSNSIEAHTPVIAGKTLGKGLNITIDASAFNKKMLISVDDKNENNIIVRNLVKQFNNIKKNVVVIDTLGVINAKKYTAGVDFKLPLDTNSLAFMYQDCLNDATADSKSMIIEIFKDLAEYSKSVPFVPFDALKTIVDDMVDKSHVFKLLVLKNKLAKFDRLGYFAKNRQEVDRLHQILGAKCAIIDLSKLDLTFQNRYLSFIYENLTDEQVLLETSNSVSKKSIKDILSNEEVATTFITHSKFKYLNDIKNVFDNFIITPSFSNNEIFNIYGTFLNSMQKGSFLIAGEATNYIPLVSSLEPVNDLIEIKEEKEDIEFPDNIEEEITPPEEEKFSEVIEEVPEPLKDDEILAGIEEKSDDVITQAAEELNYPEAHIDLFGETEINEGVGVKEGVNEGVSEEVEKEAPSTEDVLEEIGESNLETDSQPEILDSLEEVQEISLAESFETEIHPNEEIQEYIAPAEEELEEISLVQELEPIEELPEDETSIEVPNDIELNLDDETPEIIEEPEILTEQNDEMGIIPISDENYELDEIVELDPDDADENDIVIDMEEEPEELQDIDEQVVKDVDKVFTTRKDETISDSDLDFIDELNSDEDTLLEEVSEEDSVLEEISEEDGILQEDPQEEILIEESSEVLETRNTSTPIVPVYDADIPQEDMVVSDPIQQGDTVFHAKYGNGVVEKMIKYGNKTLFSINFDNIGRRLLDPTLTEIKKS